MENIFLYLGGIGGIELLILFSFLALPTILWFWALIDCVKREFKGNDKLIWVLIIIFLPMIGSILYLAIGRKNRI
jgi:hypothetical protein